MENVFNEIREERVKQDQKWGQQNYPILDQEWLDNARLMPRERYSIPLEEKAKELVDELAEKGGLTYMDILVEEICEVAACGDNVEVMRKELVQSAAVIVAMIESIDRNGK